MRLITSFTPSVTPAIPPASRASVEWTAMLAEALPDTAGACRIFRSFPWRLCVERIR